MINKFVVLYRHDNYKYWYEKEDSFDTYKAAEEFIKGELSRLACTAEHYTYRIEKIYRKVDKISYNIKDSSLETDQDHSYVVDKEMSVAELEQLLIDAKHQYYCKGNSIIDDYTYDRLETKLGKLKPDSEVIHGVGCLICLKGDK